jgi:hypothetical protein
MQVAVKIESLNVGTDASATLPSCPEESGSDVNVYFIDEM